MAFILRNTKYLGGVARILSSVVFSTPDNQAPVFTSSDSISLRQRETLNHVLTTTDNEGDPVSYSLVNNSFSWISISGSTISISPDLDVAVGNYQITARADDGTTLVDQVITITVDSAQTSVVFPIKRIVEWDEGQAPDFVIGDDFIHSIVLKAGVVSSNFDVSQASSVKVALVNKNHREAYTSVVQLSPSAQGANWSNGEILVDIPANISSEASSILESEYGFLEIEVELLTNKFTWFGPLTIIPGKIP